MPSVIAERTFVDADQTAFAAASGDWNPIHMDPLAARRTLAGRPVVHGIHPLLWALDSLCRSLPDLPAIASIEARFRKLLYVGERVQAVLRRRDERGLRLEIVADDAVAASLVAMFGPPGPASEPIASGPVIAPATPLEPTDQQMAEARGRVLLAPEAIVPLFPAAAAALGGARVAALARSSLVVGMLCPGLHSLYLGLKLAAVSIDEKDRDTLSFRVATSDPRLRFVQLAVAGGGWCGTLDALVRPAPTQQPGWTEIAARLRPKEFAGAHALVIGGSRGLGELVGKILAAGGADVTLTYARGKADARRVQAEIASGGGRCEILRYDVRDGAQKQLRRLRIIPDQMYYMATPPILRRKAAATFNPSLYAEYVAFFVIGFYDLCRELRARAGRQIAVFYPSTQFIDSRPGSMTEYAMAKAAGEVLCADMQSFDKLGAIVVRRLPRLPTDQTARLIEIETADPVTEMLAAVRAVHTSGRSAG